MFNKKLIEKYSKKSIVKRLQKNIKKYFLSCLYNK